MQKETNLIFSPFIQEAFEDTHKYTVIPSWRQSGKTYWATQWLCLMMMLNNKSRWLWCDTVQGNIGKYIDRYFRTILWDLWKSVKVDNQKYIMTFANGSIIDFGSAERPENLEWFSYDFVVLNEAGIILKKEWLWERTIQPMCKKAKVKIIWTPKGKTDQKYYELSQMEKIDNEWKTFNYSCYASPYWNKEDLDKINEQVPSYIWKQEYLAEFVDVYENSMISYEDLRFYDDVDVTQFTEVFMHTDTTHTGKETSDYSAIGVIGEWNDKNFYLLDFILEKQDVEAQARASIVMYQKWEWKVVKFTYDEKANQWFWFWVKKLAKEEYWISLPIRELKYPSDKVTHFTPHVPHFRANRVYLPKNHKRINTLVDQIIAFPTKEVNDDAVDLMSGLLDNFHKNRWPIGEVIQGNIDIVEHVEISDRWLLPEDIEEEETVFEEVEMSPY